MIPNVTISVFESPEVLAQAAAEEWVSRLLASSGAPVSAALPGGRIYRLFYQALRAEAGRHPGVLNPVHFFWGDERCVPPDDAESNFKLANDLLFQPAGINKDNIHRIPGEEEPGKAAAQAEQALRSVVSGAPVPVLDYVFLGMGEDGHVASLFPGENPAAINSPAIYRAVRGPKPPPNRVTLSYAALAAAANVWVLVSGSGKEGALRQSISSGGVTPLARVLSARKETLILTDVQIQRP